MDLSKDIYATITEANRMMLPMENVNCLARNRIGAVLERTERKQRPTYVLYKKQ